MFAANGYADTALSDIVAETAITTGAIYHHFGGKKELFQAVAENVEKDILSAVATAATSKKYPWDQLLAGVSAMLEHCTAPDVQRIVFIDAPTVIGPAAWREIEMKYAFGAMQQSLQTLISLGQVRPFAADPLASILLGALIEAAHSVARSEDQARSLKEAREMMRLLFESIKTT
ncbi:TetR/AcrR family transcriptional regulator [Parasphingorhabdus halotolerans]|uniref:TetR/AcrR family transcriptional regulator n=1 Tax=Parasphingorhabdus halotolerans TaxID=2725558 RepID=A0A6H2DMM2_9SPHN|nr:TetR/AcrR family transcriptional regulator [Parasphingorhabdus halotolerans]QJB69922.1 TetR/AcrR family transcriptional regulator [Parasphingorhabdus halotolerans]